MKKQRKIFLRSLSLSLVVFSCVFAGLFMSAKAYENTLKIRYGEYRRAIEVDEDGLRLFDFQIKF